MSESSLGRIKRLRDQARAVLTQRPNVVDDSARLSWLQQCLHFCLLVGRSFVRNQCPVRATALAYASLLALVPMLAVVASVSASLLKKEGEEPIRRFIEHLTSSVMPAEKAGTFFEAPEAEEARRLVVRRLNEFVGNIRSGTLGVTGIVALLAVAIAMLARIEDTLNAIWGVSRGRSWFSRVVLYWTSLTLGPVLLTAAFTLTSLPQFQATRSFLADLGLGVGALVAFGFRLLPFLILSLAFALLYQLMPNTRVTWRASLVGGVVGGSLWQLNNLVSVLYVSRVVSHDRIYGSLGMVPVFMIGLYFGWLILLFGAQVAYAVQNCRAYLQERQVESVSFRGREFVALRLVTAAGACFERGDKAPSCGELSSRLGIPSRLAAQLLPRLVEGRLLVEVGRNDPGYAPSRPLDRITCHDVLDALRVGQGRVLLTRADAAREQVRASYDRICEAERTVASALTIAELVRLEPGAAGTGLAEEGTVVAGAPSAGGTPSQRV